MSTSSFLKSRKLRGAANAGAAAAALAIVIPQAGSAAAGHSGTAATTAAAQPDAATGTGFPTFAHLPADQAAHPKAPEEWWYTIGHVSSHGHKYGYEVQLTSSRLQLLLLAA